MEKSTADTEGIEGCCLKVRQAPVGWEGHQKPPGIQKKKSAGNRNRERGRKAKMVERRGGRGREERTLRKARRGKRSKYTSSSLHRHGDALKGADF